MAALGMDKGECLKGAKRGDSLTASFMASVEESMHSLEGM